MGLKMEICCSSSSSFAVVKASLLWRIRGWPFNHLSLYRGELLRHGEHMLRHGEPTVANQQLHLKLVSSITLLGFPSKPTKHKKMED